MVCQGGLTDMFDLEFFWGPFPSGLWFRSYPFAELLTNDRCLCGVGASSTYMLGLSLSLFLFLFLFLFLAPEKLPHGVALRLT